MTLLVTGATGFLGGALAAELLDSMQWPRVLFLVRASDTASALTRLRENLRRFAVAERRIALLGPAQIVCGDLASVPAASDQRLGDVTTVIHCAAVTSFGASSRVFATNVRDTLGFARHLAAGARLERFVYVSTAMICGREPARVVHEDEYPSATARHFVNYTQSKAHAEALLTAELPTLPLVIARPSIIVGHTQLGCQPSGSIFWTFRIADALRMITSRVDGRIDVVPVDYAARALLLLALKPALSHSTYHISAAAAASCTWHEIAAAFARARGAPSFAYQPVRVHDVARRSAEFGALFGPCHPSFMMRAV